MWVVVWISIALTTQAIQQPICACSKLLLRFVEGCTLSPHSLSSSPTIAFPAKWVIPDAKENGVQIECSNVNQFKRVDIRKRVYSIASSSWKACKNDRDDANGVRRKLHHVRGTLEQQTASQASDRGMRFTFKLNVRNTSPTN